MLMSVNILCGKNDVWSGLSSLGMNICLSLAVVFLFADFLIWSFSNFVEVLRTVGADLLMSAKLC